MGETKKIRCHNCMKEYEISDTCPFCGYKNGTPPKEICHLHAGIILNDRYLLGTVVSYGGFGILYRAWDQKLDTMVAIKEYFPASYANRNPGEKEIFIYTSKKKGEFQEGLQGFLDEAKNTAKFNTYPNIVNVYEYFMENGTAYMVMEYMDGETLKEYTKKQGGKLPWEEAVKYISGICEDLSVVHKEGILHRDISPDNIMLLKNGTTKLFDFGAARFSSADHEMTRTIILKIGFAPPEQYRNKSRQGSFTDVYALGATLYRTITGILPDESVNRAESIRVEKKDTLIPPKELVPDIPDYLNFAILRSMAVEPELRFRDTIQLKQAIQNEKSFMDLDGELKRRKRRRQLGVGGIIAAALAGAAGCFLYYHNLKTETTLQGSRIEIWAKVEEGETIEQVQERMDQISKEFLEDYPGVALSIQCIPETDYENRLKESAGSSDFPTLFQPGMSEDFDGFIDQYAADVSSLFEMVNREDYVCYSEEALAEGNHKKVPLGISAGVVYKNIQLDSEKHGETNEEDAFMSGNSSVWIGESLDYEAVQTALPGIYDVSRLPSEQAIVKYEDIWCVSNLASEQDQNAARRFLYYCLGETSQDIFHLQNVSAMPVNKAELEIYLDINQEFDFLKEDLEKDEVMTVWDREVLYSCFEQVYEEMKSDSSLQKQNTGGE